MRNIISQGETITYTANADTKSGDPVAIGDVVGVAVGDTKAGEQGVAHVRGVYDLPKTAPAIAQGAKVFLTGGGKITTADTGNTFAGFAWAAAEENSVTIAVKLTSAS